MIEEDEKDPNKNCHSCESGHPESDGSSGLPRTTPKDDREDECAKCEVYLAGWKRAQADYANLKKEYEKARYEISMNANENLLYELLPAFDHFETALQHLPDVSSLPENEQSRIKSWLTGIMAVKQVWEQTFKEIGLENVEVNGNFDPTKHEAVGKEEDETKVDHAIIKVVQSGWKFNGKVLRPAKVIINSLND